MTGLVGIIHFDEAVVDGGLLSQMTTLMLNQGFDHQVTKFDQGVGFSATYWAGTNTGHGEKSRDQSPLTVVGNCWIVADARLDDRGPLLHQLRAAAVSNLNASSADSELILAAYRVWGVDCVDHLLGDFAFVIWDATRQQAFCARDHFGIKLFYYARSANCLVFSTMLNCLRLHPIVSNRLNDDAIADFLLFDVNHNQYTTVFKDIQRLPAAHSLTMTHHGSSHEWQPKRYWVLPTNGQIRYQQPQDYIDQFRELMGQAVSDRLNHDQVGVFMSGGLDSTTIAAIAQDCLTSRGVSNSNLRAYAMVYDSLIPDEEKTYAQIAANALGLPIEYCSGDHYQLLEGWDQAIAETPEPTVNLFPAFRRDFLALAARHSRVILVGHGADPALMPSSLYAYSLLKQGHWLAICRAIWLYLQWNRRFPPLGLRTTLRHLMGQQVVPTRLPYPLWLNPEFERRLNMRDRWHQAHQPHPRLHPTRHEAYTAMTSPTLTAIFEQYDAGVTGYPLDIRYPFLDLRLVRYLLAIPALPWFIHKQLVRRAMNGILPQAITRRAKTPLRGSPAFTLINHPSSQWLDRIGYHTRLKDYVDIDGIPPLAQFKSQGVWINLRPFSLSNWFRYSGC